MNSTNDFLSKREFKLYKRLRRLIIINHQRILTEGKHSENKKSRQQQQHKRHQNNDISKKIKKKRLSQGHKRCHKTKKIHTRRIKKENE